MRGAKTSGGIAIGYNPIAEALPATYPLTSYNRNPRLFSGGGRMKWERKYSEKLLRAGSRRRPLCNQ